MFSNKQRGTFKYTISHVLAYNMVALNLGVWRPKFIFHDWEKPWMMLGCKFLHGLGILKNEPYSYVRAWHRTHRRHHIQYYRAPTLNKGGRCPDPLEMILDWECSRFTKLNSPGNAYMYYYAKKHEMPGYMQCRVEAELQALGLWESWIPTT